MQFRTTDETRWHDMGTEVLVPAGELVEVVRIEDIPVDEGRHNIAEGIRLYEKQGRTFVPISIRDWYALIDRKRLEPVQAGPTPRLSAKSRVRPLEVPGLRSGSLAPCATE